ncbi:U2-associated protein [Schizosaccharomyces octosporus yFS286]|uniref:U2-associated protein n=1 Tax=Schizosaccharomyces octosporus (strain yFS286) TaxID=483514 RepID=S9PY01_SCHOY|nr:U2-associated protein [Schizosaccharomyces octosporus yFS286]EPX72333.1 U2-associated protein [Schizosaccharomyces octosporus yFS286]
MRAYQEKLADKDDIRMDHDHSFPLQTLETKKRPIIGGRRHFAVNQDISSDSDEEENAFFAGERQKISNLERNKHSFTETAKSGLEAEIGRRQEYALETVDQATSLSEKPCVVHLDGIAKQTSAATLKEALGGRDFVIATNVFSPEGNYSKGISVFRNEKFARDAIRRLSTKPVDGSYISAAVGTTEANDDSIFSTQRKELEKKKEKDKNAVSVEHLSTLDKAKLEWLLSRMSCEKGSIANVLCFAIDYISETIVQELLKDEDVNEERINDKSTLEKGERKLGLLYVINDLLFNGISGVPLVWRYRISLEPSISSIFDHLYAFSRRLGGRLKMDMFCKKVAQVIDVWRIAFPEEVLDSAWEMFKSKDTEASIRALNRTPTAAVHENRWATAAAEIEQDQDDQEYNGNPVNVSELLLEKEKEYLQHEYERHDLDQNAPSSSSSARVASSSTPEEPDDSVKAKFKPSFTKGTFVSRKMRMHAEDLF